MNGVLNAGIGCDKVYCTVLANQIVCIKFMSVSSPASRASCVCIKRVGGEVYI